MATSAFTNKTRVIVSDAPGTPHAIGVEVAIEYGYNGPRNKVKYPDRDVSDEVVVTTFSMQECYKQMRENPDIVALARSTSGVQYYVEPAKEFYPHVQFFIPMGSNTYKELFIFQEPEPPVIVTCGCGDDEERNNTAWGNGLEFWDTDWQWYGGTDASSFSNGWICGALWRIHDEMIKAGVPQDKAWWYARYYARMSAYRTEPNRPKDDDGNPVLWHKENGFGRPSIDWALFRFEQNYFKVPDDPYLISSALGEVGVLHADSAGHVILRLDEVANADTYTILRNGEQIAKIKRGQSLIYTDLLKDYGQYTYKYFASKGLQMTKESNDIIAIYGEKNKPEL